MVGLLSLGVSITQAVASFKALKSDSPMWEHGTTFLISEANQTRAIEVFISTSVSVGSAEKTKSAS